MQEDKTYTTEELEAFLQTGEISSTNTKISTKKDERGKVVDHRSIMNFIKEFQIQRGEVKVPTYLIFYHYYVTYQKSNRALKVGKKEFFRVFNKYFEQKRSAKQRYYMLNETLDMTDAIMEKAQSHSKKWQNKQRKKQCQNQEEAKQNIQPSKESLI